MSKRLIVCCDGTWNDPEDRTNISWLSANVAQDAEQIVHYDTGVGTHWYDQKSGGVLGVGLSRNVREAYRFVRRNYQPGDEIYCFGFSRGAFTARSLCGFMQQAGRLKSDEDIDEAYLYYRLNEPDDPPNWFERLFEPNSAGPISVRLLGVFDTVGSLGVPFEIEDQAENLEGQSLLDRARGTVTGWLDVAGDRLRRPIKGFHDTRLGTITEHAYHALAIDETRAMFAPTLWTAAPAHARRVTPDDTLQEIEQTVEQVWFTGVHSDVGGGYDTDPRLADIPLLWMVEKTSALGLRFEESAVEDLRRRTDSLAPQHDSMTATWQNLHRKLKLDPVVRPMTNESRRALNPAGDLHPEVHAREAVHASVRDRLGKTVESRSDEKPPTSGPYRPSNLPEGPTYTG